MLKKFNDYIKTSSTNPRDFEKAIAFAGESLDIFEQISTPFDIPRLGSDKPLVLWNNFKLESQHINETSGVFMYNQIENPIFEEVCDSFINEDFIPKTISDRKSVRKMEFPIVGIAEKDNEEFKTYGKFKKSEKNFSKFREKINPDTVFNVLVFKKSPLHIEEKIKGLKFDTNLSLFPKTKELHSIIEKVNEKYPLDFYNLEVFEKNNKLYLNSIDVNQKLSPLQQVKIYEAAYSDFYQAKLPNWFKNMLTEKYLTPYYKSKAYDSKLVKSRYGVNYEKYIG